MELHNDAYTRIALKEKGGKKSKLNVLSEGMGIVYKPIMPKGYALSRDCELIRTDGEKEIQIASCPVFIKSRYVNLTDKSSGIEAVWWQDGKTNSIKQTEDYFVTQNKLLELRRWAFPVNSLSVKGMIAYIEGFLQQNRAEIPVFTGSEQLGWVKGGFLLGRSYITASGDEIESQNPGAIMFTPPDVGEEQMAGGLMRRGTLGGWLHTIDRIKGCHRIMPGIYASLASPLLKFIGAERFIFEWAGTTSTGKTISMRTAASVWGNPANSTESGLVRHWESTTVGFEKYAAAMNHIPIFLDESQSANSKTVTQTIYMLSTGQERSRGSMKGSRASRGWRNISFSTGEHRLSSFLLDGRTKAGGTVARTLSVVGSPFGNSDAGNFVLSIDEAIKSDYGQAGPEFIKFLIKTKDRQLQYAHRYDELRNQYSNSQNSVAGRLAGYMAVIHLAGELAQEAIGLPFDPALMARFWMELLDETPETDMAFQAMQEISSWARQERNRFSQPINESPGCKVVWSVPDHCIGEWEHQNEWKEIRFYPAALRDELTNRGYDATIILRNWDEKGWLNTDKKTRGQQKSTSRGKVYSIKREAVEL